MRFYNYEVVIEKEPDDPGYFAYCPNLPGCFSNGETVEETKENIRESIQLHLESLLAHNEPIPEFEKLVHLEEISVGFPD